MLRNLLRWARITRAGSDAEQFAVQQTEYLGKVADTLIVFPYGVHGNAPPDALALMMAIQGNPDNRAAIAWTPKIRPKLAEGEVAFYHPPTGGLVVWRASGDLEITTKADVLIDCANLTATASAGVTVNAVTATVNAIGSVTVTAPVVTINGNVTINGGLSVSGTMTNAGKDVGATHGHIQGNDSGGSVEQPISGVT